MDRAITNRPVIGGNTNTGFLKTIAIVCMIIDHTAVVFFPGVLELRVIGRIAFPLYAWCCVVGSVYTHDHPKYLLRLFIVAIVSQPFYMYALGHRWDQLNVFATLFLGQAALFGIRSKWRFSQLWAPVLCILTACFVQMDYGWKGVAVMILMYLAKETKNGLAAVMVAFCFFWGEGTILLTSFCGIPLSGLRSLTRFGSTLYTAVFRLENLAVLSLPLMVTGLGWKKQMPKWLSYGAYPAHLAVLSLLRFILKP